MILLARNLLLILFFTVLATGADLEASPKNRCRVSFPSDSSIDWFCYQIKQNETAESLFGKHWENVLRFNRIDRNHLRPGKYIKVPNDLKSVVDFNPMPLKLDRAKDYRKYVLIDLSEQFLGAYDYGELTLSLPVATGTPGHGTPKGLFKVWGRERWHRSTKYTISGTGILYPMYWGIWFHTSKNWVRFWIHSRDMPGQPASHGCVGLYDEEMQKKFYKRPDSPELMDSKKLYLWLFPDGLKDDVPGSKLTEYPEGLQGALIEIK
ncbi:MAG: hypothetical protein COV29_02695 [Candidatus Yanofskybacteria bacterium CG10_big_fil_rev_8_21_14_0_10_36_16]|uniref:L,D-TPase catalytic domain-containing protein n=1 Tax=Candidatus Yanofskybacteria bacterium CG10_big_fil_rev_8_21_14_0_10_36_16 TaxID=1975096 RepID=A0A2J0Q7V4_9BACT|nr:MAG: hypothetical protein COV29_02695 [Candidatus Yanofskybacteria bacterium CG10_big_fil_rev_8_21_14_0_10_36_16]